MKYRQFVLFAASFVASAADAGEPGKLQREVWKDVGGSGTWHLRNNARIHAEPDLLETIDGAEAPRNWGDHYGQRLRGYLTPPESGEYRLFISGDDNCELWMGEGESKFNTSKIAWIVGLGWGHGRDWSAPREWRKIPTQQSAAVKLEAGKKYFIEVLHKEGEGDDHVSIGWLKPGSKDVEVIPPSALESYSRSKDPEDVDQDELADAWEESAGLNPRDQGRVGASDFGALGDPDGDRLKNWEEQKHQTDPKSDRGRSGHLQRDIWYGVWGRSVENLMGHASYYRKPDRRDLVKGAATDTDYGDQCGVRLRGFLLPPDSGEYEFWIAGDDHCELWLSDGESKFNVKRLAAIDGGPGFVKPGEWDKLETQYSGPVRLAAGKRYYLEVLLKEGWWEDFVSVAWRKPGGDREIIPAAFLESFVPLDEDRDDDGLPGEWESAFGLDPLDSEGGHGALGDPDGDMIPNFLEYQDGTSPVVPNPLKGAATLQVWYGLGGVRVDDLVKSKKFLDAADNTSLHLGALDLGSRGDRYGMRVRYRITPPVSGEYRFWIAGDNHCELWLSDDDSKFGKSRIASVKGPGNELTGDWVDPHQWDWQASQRSESVRLEAGKEYFMEVLHKESGWGDYVAVAWQGPGVPKRDVVQAAAISSFIDDPADRDDDYLPDDWESKMGLSADDNGFQDSRQGEYGDYDQDGLTNRDEFLFGTNPCNTDSDGDGVGDHDELKVYGSDPAVKDASPPVIHANLPLAGHVSAPGLWTMSSSGTLFSRTRRGSADFSFELDAPGIYLVEFRGNAVGASDHVPPVPVIGKVNGTEVGRGEVGPQGATFRWLTPWLASGRHTVSIDNRNVRVGVALEIASVTLYRHEGGDIDANGIPDWMEGFVRKGNQVDSATIVSAVSPLCLEGASRFPGDAVISASGEVIRASAGLAGRWFADVDLDEDVDTQVRVTYENGALLENVSLRWKTTNLFEADAKILVRVGDSLKVTALPPGTDGSQTTTALKLDGATVGNGSATDAHVIEFSKAGTHVLTATTLTGPESLDVSVEVEVVEAEFGKPLDIASGYKRLWRLPGISRDLAVEADSPLELEERATKDGEVRQFDIRFPNDLSGTPRVLARLWDGGPVAAATDVNAFRIVPASESGDIRVVDVLPDGTRVVELVFLIDGKVPADLSVWLEFYVTDAVFANGDSRYRLTADDFDANGMARILMYKAPGEDVAYVCHWIRPHEEDGGEAGEIVPAPPEQGPADGAADGSAE